jgi:hypothetical protein
VRRHLRRVLLAGEILVTYPRAWWVMRKRPLPQALAILRVRSGEPIEDVLRARQIGHAVSRLLAPLPVDSRCLIRSLVLVRMLDRRDIPTRLIIGVQPGAADFAHAWVEVAGQPVLDPGEFHDLRLAEL